MHFPGGGKCRSGIANLAADQGDIAMVAFLREHVIWAIIGAYVLGQISTALVLGVLVPRDPAREQVELDEERLASRLRPRRVRRISGATNRVTARSSLTNRLRRFIHEQPTVGMN
jgi:hypothetical protein